MQVIVAGAGLAGLSAARELEARGATITVIEARDRVGGASGPCATASPAGSTRRLAPTSSRMTRNRCGSSRAIWAWRPSASFVTDSGSTVRMRADGRRIQARPGAFRAVSRLLRTEIADFKLAESRWDSAIAARFARQSVCGLAGHRNASPALRAGVRASAASFSRIRKICRCCRCIEQFAEAGRPGQDGIFRIPAATIASRPDWPRLRGALLLRAIVRRVRQGERGMRHHRGPTGRRSEIDGDVPRLRAARVDGARRRVRPGVAGAAAAGDLALAIRVRDAHAAAVRAPILEEARPAYRVRY